MVSPVVLVVDDLAPVRSTIARTVKSEFPGVRTLEAGDGHEALALHREHGAALIITDLRMPRMDGFELIRQLRAVHDLTPVIALSMAFEARKQALAAGANAFVDKGLTTIEDLRVALHEYSL